jgi:hypothetical protein
MSRNLNERGYPSEINVFEDLLHPDKYTNIEKTKEKFRNNFAFALMAQRLAKDPTPYLQSEYLVKRFSEWDRVKVKAFIVLSGFWIPVIDLYLATRVHSNTRTLLCHLDSAESTSWSLYSHKSTNYEHIWFCNWGRNEINFQLPADRKLIRPFNKRENSLIVHGGGWGIGTYRESIERLENAAYALDIIVYQVSDIKEWGELNRYYLLDIKHLPSLSRLGKENEQVCKQESVAYVQVLIENCKGIVSKPGAGTLIDSLAYATPLIYLAPFGRYEEKNALLWKNYGLGISFEEWGQMNFSEEYLEKVHQNLVEVKNATPNFIDFFIKNYT